MKPLVLLLGFFLFVLILQPAFSGSATWNLNPPAGGDWNNASNWTPNTVPNGPSDTASFDMSTQTELFFSAATEVNSLIFSPGASSFTFTLNPNLTGITFTISGAGITNNSGLVQNFVVAWGNPSHLAFTNNAVAGNLIVITNTAGTSDFSFERQTLFYNSSSAGQCTINNEGSDYNDIVAGSTVFLDTSTAGNATVINEPGRPSGTRNPPGQGGTTSFFGSSNAGSGIFMNPSGGFWFSPARTAFYQTSSAAQATLSCGGGTDPGTARGAIDLFDSATADTANFTANGGTRAGAMAGTISLFGTATAADATFTLNAGAVSGGNGGSLQFHESSTAGNATLIANGDVPRANGGSISFRDLSDGGTAQVKLFGNSSLNIVNHRSPGLTIGSLEGDGQVFLGNDNLRVGSNNLPTEFSGIAQDAGIHGGTRGSLSKIGSGTFILSGANLYTGGTAVIEGILVVDNTTGSGTGTGPVSVNGGGLGGSGIISGPVAIGNGSGRRAFLAPAHGTKVPATLTVQSSLTFSSDAIYAYIFDARKNEAGTDQVIANGVAINNGASFAFHGLAKGKLQEGLVFPVISNTSANPITGTFSNLPDGAILTVDGNNLQASYFGGDGNDLTLAVVP